MPLQRSALRQKKAGLRGGRALAIVVLAIASALYAGYRSFIGFSSYDDEGSLILMSRWLLEGHPVYRDFQSIYGPFYFLYRWFAHSVAGGVSHTAARLIGIVPWALTSLVAFVFTLRITRSRVAALTAWVICLRILSFIASEPAHPQEICILLLVGLIAMARRAEPWRFAITGVLLAFLILTKVNIGVFAGAGFALAIVSATRYEKIRSILLPILALGAVIGPVILVSPLLNLPWVDGLCGLILVSILAVLAALFRRPPEFTLDIRHWSALVGGVAGAAIALLAWTVGQGGSLRSMLQSTVLANLEHAHAWTFPVAIGVPGIVACVISLASLALSLRGNFRGIHWVKFAAGAVTITLLLLSRPQPAFAIGLPFTWLVMVPRRGFGSPRFARVLLACIMVMHSLTAYPVAASQLRFTLVLLTILTTIYWHDALSVLVRQPAISGKSAMAVPVAVYVFSVVSAAYYYTHLTPLGLPGTAGIRLDAGERAGYQWVTAKIQSRCKSFIAFPAMYSLYFWTGKRPPLYPDLDGWQPYINPERQAIEKRVLSDPDACVFLVDKLVPFWLPVHDTMRLTLLGFIQERFVETESHRGFRLMVRKSETPAR